jgi:glycosyltransferase involved in cell wall biosynthesis
MSVDPLVSVIIPTYNRPEFLAKTIKSILVQTYTNMEILVISNGVNEQNRRVVESTNDPRIIYKEQENSGGPASPRNYGIRLAKGKYVAFCDDDDFWLTEKIAKQVLALENNADYGLCYTKMMRFDNEHKWSVLHEEGPANLRSLLYVNTVPISSVFIRKSLVDLHGGFSENKIVGTSEDYEFLLRHSLNSKFLFLDEYLIEYWTGDKRTTSTDKQRTIVSCVKYLSNVLGCYYLLCKKQGVSFSILLEPILFQIRYFLKTASYLIVHKFY